MLIDATRVHDILLDCLFRKEEIVDDMPILKPIIVRGIKYSVGLHPERVESHRKEIYDIIDNLPEEFREGYSFLNLCSDKDGNIWGEHRDCDELIMLGLAIERMNYTLPRELWSALPGGVPYITTK